MLGDNAYPYGSQNDYQRAVFDVYPTFLRKLTLWSTLGNHETYSGEPNPYFGIFTFPTQGEAGGVPSGSEHYYSFDYGPVHFVCLDSQSSSRQAGSPMLTWLEADLSSTQAKWIIAFWHHPPYSRGSHNSDTTIECIEMRQNALPILEAYGVDLVFAGHSHSYERSMLIDGHYGTPDTLQPGMIKDSRNGKFKGPGPYTKTTQSHGGTVYTVCGVSGQVGAGTYDHPVMIRSLPVLGSMVLDVKGNRLNARFLQANRAFGDSFSMVKP
jgi:3',5'-cyclic AMP phosphodiesterase CpdA